MTKRKSNYLYGGIGLAILAGLIWYGASLTTKGNLQSNDNSAPKKVIENPDEINETKTQSEELPNKILIAGVPFTSQAPTGQWSDDRQQNDCEEAAVFMATKWMKGESLGTIEDTLTELLALSKLAESLFGTYVDSSASDTLKLFRKYTNTSKGSLSYDVTIADIKKELAGGRIIIAPMDGQALHNPNFTAGGPERHFLVIIGYDDKTEMFTTQDPGTRNGRNYRYTYETLYSAMRDYPTGDHVKITNHVRAMIAISKN